MPTIKIHDVTTGQVIEREMNSDELARLEADQVEHESRMQAKEEAEAAKAALLERLGITAEEARLLLGGTV